MRILKIKTKTGIKTVYDVTDWGWSAETGDLYYRTEKGLHHKYCMYECPSCGSIDVYGQEHCDDCGQRLDWSGFNGNDM